MRNFNLNIGTLFSSLGNNNNTFNFSDYASIKNGSYGKLMKSYYAEQKKDTTPEKTPNKTTVNKNKSEQLVDKTGLTQMKKEADGLKSAVDALAKDDLWKSADRDKIAGAVKNFVNEYNDVIAQSKKVNGGNIAQSTKYMSSMTDTMSKALSKAGISVGSDGKLSLDEDALSKASVDNVKSLFNGKVSYGSQIADKASEISRDTLMNSSVYSSNGTLSSALSGMFNNWV